MSKRYTYRRYRRTYPKQKWQLSLVEPTAFNFSPVMTAQTFVAKHSNICQTVVPTDATAASVVSANNIVKTGNFRVKGSFNIGGTDTDRLSIIIYVIFVPQGIDPDNTGVSTTNLATSIFYSHPEWVLCWTRRDMDNSTDNDDFSMSSRLKRNLNSGDSVKLGILIMNNTNSNLSAVSVRLSSTVQYAARAN